MRRRSRRAPNLSESTGKIGQELPADQPAPLVPSYLDPEPAPGREQPRAPPQEAPPAPRDAPARARRRPAPAQRRRGIPEDAPPPPTPAAPGWFKTAKTSGCEVQAAFRGVRWEGSVAPSRQREREVSQDVMRKMAERLKPPVFEEG